MQDTGFKLPLAVVGNGVTTGNQWTNPNNILLVDGNVASSVAGPTSTSDITIGNFNFNIPQGATINGIEYKVIGYRGPQTVPPITLTVYAEDDTSTFPVYYPDAPFTGLSQTMTSYLFGSSTFLFSTTWTDDQINNLKLNLVALGEINLDSVLVRVFYTPAPPPGPTPTVNTCVEEMETLPFNLAQELKATDAFMVLKSFNYPSPANSVPTPIIMIGPYIDLVVDKGLGTMENVRVDTISTLPNGYVRLDFLGGLAGRGLPFVGPSFVTDPTLIRSHVANAEVIISNSSPFYDRFLKKCQIGTLVSPPIYVDDEGVQLPDYLEELDFQGPGVVATNDPLNSRKKNIFISGSGTTPPHVFSTGGGTTDGSVATTLQFTLNIGGTNRGNLVQISTQQSLSIVSVTIGGSPAAFVEVSTSIINDLRQEQWFNAAAPLGVQNVVITLSAPGYMSATAECWNNLDTSAPIGNTVGTTTGVNANPSILLTTGRDNSIVVDGLASLVGTITQGAGQSLNGKNDLAGDTRKSASSYLQAGTAPDNITNQYTTSIPTAWAITSVELQGITSTSADQLVKVDASDTTSDYLDPKLNIHSSDGSVIVSKTITNPGGNEILDYDLTTAGGSGGGNLIKDDNPGNISSQYTKLDFDPDGVRTVFTVSAGVYISGTLTVWLNGQEIELGTDWVEFAPGSGQFAFAIPPLGTDQIYVEYYDPTSVAQVGIQMDLNGALIPGAVAGATNELDLVAGGNMSISANYVGGKTTYTFNASSSGSLTGGMSFVPIAKYVPNAGTGNERGDDYRNNVFVVGSRLYADIQDGNSSISSNQSTNFLRIFNSTYGTYFVENELRVLRSELTYTGAGNSLGQCTWATDGINIFAILVYTKTSGSNVTHFRRIDLIRYDLDGTNPVAVNLFAVTGTSNGDIQRWQNRDGGSQFEAFTVVGTSLFTTWSSGGVDQFREYDISAFPTVTLTNTYTATGIPDSAELSDAYNLSYDSTLNVFYFGGTNNGGATSQGIAQIDKWEINGSNFNLLGTARYDELAFGNVGYENDARDGNIYSRMIDFGTYNSIYTVQSNFSSAGGTSGNSSLTYWLMVYNMPKF